MNGVYVLNLDVMLLSFVVLFFAFAVVSVVSFISPLSAQEIQECFRG